MEYKHYIRLDESNCIIKAFTDAFEIPVNDDICINEQGGRHFELEGVVNPALFNEKGVALFKYEDGKVVKRTKEEIEETDNPQEPVDRLAELEAENAILKAQNKALADRTDFHEEVLTEIILAMYS